MCHQKIGVDLDLVVCARKMSDGLLASLIGLALHQKHRFVRLWDPFHNFESLELLVPAPDFFRVSPNETVNIFLLEYRFLRQTVHNLVKNHALAQAHLDKLSFFEVKVRSQYLKS